MNPFRKLLTQGLDTLRGNIPAAVQPAPKAETPAVKVEAWNPTKIEAADFKAGNGFRADEWFTLASFKAPKQVAWKIPVGLPFRAYFKALKTQAGANGTIDNFVTVNLPGLIRTTQGLPSLPTLYHPEIAVWCKVAGVWKRAEIRAVNYSTGDVLYTQPAGTTDVEAYYVHSVGEWRLRTTRDLGNSDSSAVSIVNSSFGATHAVDQNSSETNHKWPREILLLEGFRFSLEVKSSLPHVFNERAGHVLIVQALRAEVATLDKTRLAQLAEIDLRGGI